MPPRAEELAERLWPSEQEESEKGEVLLGVVDTLRYLFPPNASVQWQPDGLTIHTKKWLPRAGFLGAPPISLDEEGIGTSPRRHARSPLCARGPR